MERLPGVGEARPSRCPPCGVPGVGLDGRVNLHGHGLRERTISGPPQLGAAPELNGLILRRFECQRCRAVLVVGPRGIVPGYLYSAMALGLALLLWGALRQRDEDVQRAISINRLRGQSRPERWQTARRWAKAAAAGEVWSSVQVTLQGTRRELAERVSRILCARAGPAPTDAERIWSASGHAR